ncbi:MAG: hypothetical protein AAF735_07340 [Myxococcota bacterium]
MTVGLGLHLTTLLDALRYNSSLSDDPAVFRRSVAWMSAHRAELLRSRLDPTQPQPPSKESEQATARVSQRGAEAHDFEYFDAVSQLARVLPEAQSVWRELLKPTNFPLESSWADRDEALSVLSDVGRA